ncbi:hypothetical protein K493DRAFT_298028 [Basidiobolus meristosporus CBS 931.73]|uniref:Uncharacterized protein n=1 Tax=Basidiobolus meristosporus CBS 931.73 TaxID=1314790 RepID=A0A1Y1YX31_9FUNG|nr:hypothetical protein K493DRAFT_298028 [Basidiobolus meristosporus CBS 931.73]|eukprot:ORY02247.1 hypothetical protein K493DRAFT_298028 [Basidiobolus meristosporus CBS 931.73]
MGTLLNQRTHLEIRLRLWYGLPYLRELGATRAWEHPIKKGNNYLRSDMGIVLYLDESSSTGESLWQVQLCTLMLYRVARFLPHGGDVELPGFTEHTALGLPGQMDVLSKPIATDALGLKSSSLNSQPAWLANVSIQLNDILESSNGPTRKHPQAPLTA